jgi:hypothetical protein
VSVVARRVAAVPRRTSVETWQKVTEIVSARDSDARAELENVTSVAATLIAEEHTKSVPITISGGGPLVRIYTLHGDEAIEADLSDEDDLTFDPTEGDSWLLSLPAAGPDLAAAEGLLADAPHVEVRDVEQAERSAAAAKSAIGELALDLEELARP